MFCELDLQFLEGLGLVGEDTVQESPHNPS